MRFVSCGIHVEMCGDEKKRSHVFTQYCVCIIIYSNIIVINTFICAVSSCLILLRCLAEHLQGFATTGMPSLTMYHGRGGGGGDTRFSTTGNDGILLSTFKYSTTALCSSCRSPVPETTRTLVSTSYNC